MPRRLIALTTLVFALALASCNNAPVSFHGKDITGVMPDLQFQLTGEQGQTVTEQRFQDKAVILFFGYTHCPDFCPTTLTSLAQALKKLPEQTREQIRVMFVSVDPDRDTPELLKKYTGYFGPRIVGLTGNKEQLDTLTKRYRTTYGYDEPDENGNYLVSHGLAMYGFDKQGKVHLFMRNDQPVDQIAEDLAALAGL
ncbi:SCO family protein [Alloalcanivorax mobilis]|uniref:SCO family protein n=1 Tax=Alloalcanivorax mobilis TaxID=2019569 RepID=UPI000B5B2642|nr:SCO family protein [Alloalcanivorax mobilis]ASK36406.1 cytochrome c oxidase assembly protein [Alcanivorax sp. N3-2A]|tara:strand:- start:3705 stop:4295 length:591 start_codon:yes stop_codon:yes gene_type:complete